MMWQPIFHIRRLQAMQTVARCLPEGTTIIMGTHRTSIYRWGITSLYIRRYSIFIEVTVRYIQRVKRSGINILDIGVSLLHLMTLETFTHTLF